MAGIVACNNSTAPRNTPGLQIVSGNHQTDTIQSTLPASLVVKVVPPSGQSAQQQVVFTALPVTVNGVQTQDVYLTSVTAPGAPLQTLAETTSTAGEASVGVVLGTGTATVRVIASVAALSLADTATFTVAAGNPVSFTVSDTLAYEGSSLALTAAASDRFGNPTSGAVSYSVLSGPGSISGSTLSVSGYGVINISAKTGSLSTAFTVTGVPSGTIAASADNGGGIVVFNLDGTNYRSISNQPAGTVKWAPNGQSIVFDETQTYGLTGGSSSIQSVTLGGVVSTIDNTPGSLDAWPNYSRDGTWIYYAKIGTSGTIFWRAHPDGTSDTPLSIPSGELSFPSVSPDGTELAFTVYGFGDINVASIATGSPTDIHLGALYSQFAPQANQIAFIAQAPSANPYGGVVTVANSDGSAARAISNANMVYAPQFDWSPDGNWIIVRNLLSGQLELIGVTNGLDLVLPYSGHIGSPSWH